MGADSDVVTGKSLRSDHDANRSKATLNISMGCDFADRKRYAQRLSITY